MSTLATNAITDASGGNTATINGYTPTVSNMAGRNRIINGDMRIDQRNAGAAVTATGSYPVDRFIVNNNTDGAFSAQQDSSAPVGFTTSLKYTTTTADASVTGTKTSPIIQVIEGLNCSDLAWGTANAQPVTLSFWVRSSLTGAFGGSLRNSDSSRSYPFSYSISAANTWEQKSVTIAGDTTGTWLTDNGSGIKVQFSMGSGPDRSGTAGVWNSNNNTSVTGAVSVISTLNATFYITGVQLEAGSVATPFEHRMYGQELALCQRYYEVGDHISYFSTDVSGSFNPDAVYQTTFKVQKRAAATMTTTNYVNLGSAVADGPSNPTAHGFRQSIEIAGGGSVGGHDYNWQASAEL